MASIQSEKESFESIIEKMNNEVNTHNSQIGALYARIRFVESLKSTVNAYTDAKVIDLSYAPRAGKEFGLNFNVSLPNIEALGVFLRELGHLKSRYTSLSYSGRIDDDGLVAHVEYEKEAEG